MISKTADAEVLCLRKFSDLIIRPILFKISHLKIFLKTALNYISHVFKTICMKNKSGCQATSILNKHTKNQIIKQISFQDTCIVILFIFPVFKVSFHEFFIFVEKGIRIFFSCFNCLLGKLCRLLIFFLRCHNSSLDPVIPVVRL